MIPYFVISWSSLLPLPYRTAEFLGRVRTRAEETLALKEREYQNKKLRLRRYDKNTWH